jgi:hypothetical protein
MLHEGNDIAALVAPATIPDLLMPIDAEPIASTANWARSSIFDGGDALERRVAARDIKNVRPLRSVDEVRFKHRGAVDHMAPSDTSPSLAFKGAVGTRMRPPRRIDGTSPRFTAS